MKSELTIGKILRPRGLKGEVKIEIYSSDSARLLQLKNVKVDGITRTVEKLSAEGAYGYLKLEEVDDVETAELLRGKELLADRSALPPLPEGKHYIVDIIGLDVILSGQKLGEIVDVMQYGSADVYVVKTNDGSVSFPAIEGAVESLDPDGGKLVVNDRIFPRIAVYN